MYEQYFNKIIKIKELPIEFDLFILDIIPELNRLEFKIAECAIYQRKAPSFNIGEIVAVLITEWDKWVRARIECDSKDGQQFLLWTIDYGLPVIATSKKIIALPFELAHDPMQVVFLGGLVDCVPIEMEFDVKSRCVKPKRQPKWSAKAIQSVENIFKNADVIEFVPVVFNHKGRHNFGQLLVRSKFCADVVVAKTLYDLNVAMPSNDFIKDLNEIETLDDEPWLTADAEVKICKNIFTPCTDNAGAIIQLKFHSQAMENHGACYNSYDHMRRTVDDGDETLSVCNTELNEFFDSSASAIGNPTYELQPNQLQTKPSVQNRLMHSTMVKPGSDVAASDITINQVNMSCKAGRKMKPIVIPRLPHQSTPPPISNSSNISTSKFGQRLALLHSRSSPNGIQAETPLDNLSSETKAVSTDNIMPSTFGGYGGDNVPDPNYVEATKIATTLLKALKLTEQQMMDKLNGSCSGGQKPELKSNRHNNFDRPLNGNPDTQQHRRNGAYIEYGRNIDRHNDEKHWNDRGHSNRNFNGRSKPAGALNNRLNK